MALTTNRFLSAGTKMLVKDTNWRVFAGIVNIPGPSIQTDDIEVTELDPYQDSTTTPAAILMIKKWLAGWADIGEIALEMNMTSQEFDFAVASQLARTPLYWKINLRNGYSILLVGYIKATGADMQKDNLAKMPVTIKLTDAIYHVATGSGAETAWGS